MNVNIQLNQKVINKFLFLYENHGSVFRPGRQYLNKSLLKQQFKILACLSKY